MNVKALHRADRWIGVPICFAFTVLGAIFRRLRASVLRPPRKILFVKLAEQGSTVLAYPALRRATEMVGGENVYFLVFEDNRFILDALGAIPAKNVLTISMASMPKLLLSLCRTVWRLRHLNVDTTVDMEFFSCGSAILSYLSGAQRRVGFHAFFGGGPYRGNLMTHRLLYNPHLHTSETFLTLVEATIIDPATLPTVGFKPQNSPAETPQFKPTLDEVTHVWKLLKPVWCNHWPLILLNANSSDLLPLRRWPAKRYVDLARRLLERFEGILVVFTGSIEEKRTTDQLVNDVGSDRCVCLAGRTTLRQLLTLYTIADVLVTNDSGPAHFAALTPIRVVTLFGPETPDLFAARTPRNVALWAGLSCSPCISAFNNRRSHCHDNQCMSAISVENVLTAVSEAVAGRQNREAQPLPLAAD